VGNPLTEEEAKFYFSLVNPKEGDLSLEELDTVTGGDIPGESSKDSSAYCKNWHCFFCGTYAEGQQYCECGCSVGGIMTSCSNCENRLTPYSNDHCSQYLAAETGC
ncbi:MAG: hypothetical protein RRY80_07665, partial [Lachnospiraceae bacterium]